MSRLLLFKKKYKKILPFPVVILSIVIIFSLVLGVVYCISYDIFRLFAISFATCFLSLILIFIAMIKGSDDVNWNQLYDLIYVLNQKANGKKKESTCIEKLYLFPVYSLYLLLDPISNFIRVSLGITYEDKKKSYKYIDCSVIVLLVLSIGAYCISCFEHKWWVASFYIWLVLNIVFNKLKQIGDIAQPSAEGDVLSLRRTVILSLINIVQLLFAYAYFYRYFDIVAKDKNAFLHAFRVFTTQGIEEKVMYADCPLQHAIIISQLVVLLIVFVFFIGNMFSIRGERG
jgi:hypothetical protein